jgi:hypothetical protein
MRIAIVLMLLISISGCDWLYGDFEPITLEDFNRLKCEWQDPKVSKWYYTGTEDGSHLLVYRDVQGDKHYKIKVSELKIDNPKHVSSNEAKWEKMPWGPNDAACKQ